MSSSIIYQPVQFYALVFLASWTPMFIAAFLSQQKGKDKVAMSLLMLSLFAPAVVAIGMIYNSENQTIVQDFWSRLLSFKMEGASFALLAIIVPTLFFLSTMLSLFFGKSVAQFSITSELQVFKGWRLFGLFVPLMFAPLIEEIAWRGYGVDSLRSHHNLLYTSLIFGALWSLWHLPLFFVKGFYQNKLWNFGLVYVFNFFVSVMPGAILVNWVFYHNEQSIPIAILAHAILNGVSTSFKTEQLTKCIFTLALILFAMAVVFNEMEFFFS